MTTLTVEPEIHEHGRAWHWAVALHDARDACSGCRPSIPCHRHVGPRYTFIGYDSPGSPAIGLTICQGCGDQLGIDLGATIIGKSTMLAAACPACVVRYCGSAIATEVGA